MLRKERDTVSVEDDSDTTASLSGVRNNINVEDDSDTTVSFSRDQDVGGSSGVEEVETSYVEERSLVHGEEQQTAKVAVGREGGKVDEEAVKEQADQKEMEEGSTSNISNRFLRLID